ncbi:lipid binding [Chrysochromulina tobinii]|uniref:Lipid binding n=1 Tax=Chrysochromulina tobinii TaxID=1460289 RepID=A0A0M0J4H3_9EUKA|nr:lipid binding [Chrysochromulina tobinii]|eukprot:KOO21499.1 lipid binding [Chrysochromulina sp. CCMP291]
MRFRRGPRAEGTADDAATADTPGTDAVAPRASTQGAAGTEVSFDLSTRPKSRGGSQKRQQSPFPPLDPMAGAVGVGVGVVLLLVALIFFFFLRSRRRLSYEELPIMANKEDERGGSCDTQHDPNMAPKPLPPPSLLSDRSSRASAVQRSRLELRKLESDLLEGSDSFFPPDGSGGAPAGEQCWAPLSASQFHVRASSYLKDGRNAPSSPGSELLAVELFRTPTAAYHLVARRDDCPAHTLSRRTAEPVRLVVVINMILPAADGVYQVVFYHAIPDLLAPGGSGSGSGDRGEEEEEAGAASRLLERFVNGTDAFRNARFKLIPSVVEGPWLVQQTVGTRPALLGKTLRQRFHRGVTANGTAYLEIDVDCNSSPTAGRVVSLVKLYSKQLVIDLGFVIEAQTRDELPERVLGCGRVMRIALDDELLPRWPYELDEGDEDTEVV